MRAFYHAKSTFLTARSVLMRNLRYWLWPLLLIIIALVVLLADFQSSSERAESSLTTYAQSRQLFWETLYADGGETLYCGVTFVERPDNRFINIEHVFPMSWVSKALDCGTRRECQRNSPRFNQIEADMHNLYPALARINSARGAMAFGIIEGEEHLMPGCDFEIDHTARRVEPRPAVRGNIARAMLYMEEQYPELSLFPQQRQLLQAWHLADPPDADEIRRNRIIEQLQGNANPYIE